MVHGSVPNTGAKWMTQLQRHGTEALPNGKRKVKYLSWYTKWKIKIKKSILREIKM